MLVNNQGDQARTARALQGWESGRDQSKAFKPESSPLKPYIELTKEQEAQLAPEEPTPQVTLEAPPLAQVR